MSFHPQGWTPMHGSSQYGHVDCVRELHKFGAEVNCSDKYVSIGSSGRYFRNHRLFLDATPFFADCDRLISNEFGYHDVFVGIVEAFSIVTDV